MWKNDTRTRKNHIRFHHAIYTQTCSFLRCVLLGANYQKRKYSLLVLLILGLAGVLIDLDHLVVQQMQMVRPLHLQVFVSIWAGYICYGAYTYRRVHHARMKEQHYEVA